MKHLLALATIAIGLAAVSAQNPSSEGTKQTAARRQHLETMGAWFRQPSGPLKDADVEKALKQFEHALTSKLGPLFEDAVTDLTNGHYRAFPPDAILRRLLPCLKTPETTPERMNAQGFIMEYLGRGFGPKAREALPDLVRIITDVKYSGYLRGQAIEAAARIGPGDKDVVAAFIEAANNPEPKDSSGVHERIAEKLGDIGKAAWPAKKALLKIFERDPWYEDYAFIALGKLAMDEKPRPLAEYLDRLAKLEQGSLEEAAAAFLHVQKICKPDSATRPPNFAAESPARVDFTQPKKLDFKQAELARPVLLKIVDDRPGDDAFIRAALRTLWAIGPGGSPEAARVIVGAVTRQPRTKIHAIREDASALLAMLEPSDKAAVPFLAAGLDRLLKEDGWHDWPRSRNLAEALARYGKEARPAVPALLRVLESFKKPAASPAYEELAACASALAAAGGEAPGARAMLLHLLDPRAPLLKKAGASAPGLQARLLLEVARMGIPAAGEEREALLDHLRGALGSNTAFVFHAGAKAVTANSDAFTDKETITLVPLLARPLAADFRFKDPAKSGSNIPLPFTFEEGQLLSMGHAVRALGSLGSRAVDVLPELDTLAERPLVDVKGTYLPEPPMNHVIREARKAVKQIRANR